MGNPSDVLGPPDDEPIGWVIRPSGCYMGLYSDGGIGEIDIPRMKVLDSFM